MRETMSALFLLLLMSAVCWFLVFNKSGRYKAGMLYKVDQSQKERKEMYDAAYLAGALVLALVFTTFFFFILIAAIVG